MSNSIRDFDTRTILPELTLELLVFCFLGRQSVRSFIKDIYLTSFAG